MSKTVSKKLFPFRGKGLFETFLSFPFSVSVKESEIHGRLGEEFPKAEIFESRKLGHLGGCLLSLEEFSSENIFMDDVEEYIYIYMQRNIVGLEGRGKW